MPFSYYLASDKLRLYNFILFIMDEPDFFDIITCRSCSRHDICEYDCIFSSNKEVLDFVFILDASIVVGFIKDVFNYDI